MRALPVLALIACSSSPKPAPVQEPAPPTTEPAPAPAPPPATPTVAAAPPSVETLAGDTPKTTVAGNTFIAPAGWTITVRGAATILAPPEPDAHIVFVDVQAASPEEAVKLGWAAYKPDAKWPLLTVTDAPDHEGWTDRHSFAYQTSPNEKRDVGAGTNKANGAWLVWIYDVPTAIGEKRGAQVALIFDRLQPKGYERESFAGKQAHELDKDRIAALTAFVKAAEEATGVPGVSFGLVMLATLATVQPTSKFGEMFQYSNLLAGAAGYVAGHVAYPKLELGKAYDQAMQAQVFGPLGMAATTFDYAQALRGNHAMPHSPDVDGKPQHALMELNYSVIPVRPAGAGWSSVNDMLKYVQMELAQGTLPGGKKYISKEPLLERRVPQVPTGKDETYGMGLEVDTTSSIPVVHHGGDMIGFHSDMMWLPDHDVGAVILTNGDPGWQIRTNFRRKLLEVLFDGKPEADADQAAQAKSYAATVASARKLLTIPADPTEAGKLAAKYHNDARGDLAVVTKGGKVVFDFGEFKSEMASRKDPDGSITFVTLVPGFSLFELVVGSKDGKRTLIVRDAQHEYVFVERA